jgi:hypothetical protein
LVTVLFQEAQGAVADQVVEPVAAGCVLLEQVDVEEFFETGFCVVERGAGEGCGRGGGTTV